MKTIREFGVSTTSVYKWEWAYKKDGEKGLERKVGKGSLEAQELNRLRQENGRLKAIVAEKELQLRIQDELLKKSL